MIGASARVLLALFGSDPRPVEPPVEPPMEPRVRWDAPPGCGTASELRDRVAQQRGALEADTQILGRVRRAGGLHELELELVVDGERQARSFSAVDCRTLLDAAVIVSSAALGPSTASADPPAPDLPAPATGPDPTAVPVPPSADPAPPPRDLGRASEPEITSLRTARAEGDEPAAGPSMREPTPRPRLRRRGHWLVAARGGLGYDSTLAAPMGSLALGRGWRRWRVQALVDAFGGQATGPFGALGLWVVTLGPRACATARVRPRVELSPCVGAAAGPAVGRGRAVVNPRTAVVPWLAAHVDFGVRVVPRPWLAVGIELSNYALLGRPLFVLSDQRTVYRAGSAGARAFLTVELRFSATDSARAGH